MRGSIPVGLCRTRRKFDLLFAVIKQMPVAFFLFCAQMQGVADVEGHDHMGGEAGRDGVHNHDEGRAAVTVMAGQSIDLTVL